MSFFSQSPPTHSSDEPKNELKPHLKKYWCIAPTANAAFVAAMEDVLEVYQCPYDASKPLICLAKRPNN